jgi:RimJ/RimL family protein N-acetyltransferase
VRATRGVATTLSGGSPVHLRLPRDRFAHGRACGSARRAGWWTELDGDPVGFSTADTITLGRQARMHLHIVDPDRRRAGIGVQCVQETAELYFDVLQLERLICEPNAFNVAPNRTLQRAGFRYEKTHMTVPGWLNYHQAVTRWVLERGASHSSGVRTRTTLP